MTKNQLKTLINAYAKDRVNAFKWEQMMNNIPGITMTARILDDDNCELDVLDFGNTLDTLLELILKCYNIEEVDEHLNPIPDYDDLVQNIHDWLLINACEGETFQDLDDGLNEEGYYFGGKNETV